MKNIRKLLTYVLAAAMMALMFAGCAPEAPAAGSDPAAAEPGQTTGLPWSDGSDSGAEAPFVFDYSGSLDERGYWQGISAKDYVTLPVYKGVGIPADIHNISDEAVEQEIAGLLADYADLEHLTDRPVADGDTVNIDYVGSVAGVEFEGGTTQGQGTLVTIGVTRYIDDFLEQLIGHMPGETIDVNVTFPADYGKEELNGKDALFVTTINYIEGSEYITPELSDEFVNQYFYAEGWATVEQLREGVKEDLQGAAVAQFLQSYILDNSVISSIPQQLLDYQRDSCRNYHESQAAYYGMEIADYCTAYGVSSMDEIIEGSQPEIEKNARLSLIVQAMAEDFGLVPDDGHLEQFFLENGITDPASYIDYYGAPYFKMIYINQTALGDMIDSSVFE